jgi:hypothetical protein
MARQLVVVAKAAWEEVEEVAVVLLVSYLRALGVVQREGGYCKNNMFPWLY